MIKKLRIRNFKSWKKLDDLKLGKVTLLFGENSSGKTSLIQLLLMLKQTAESYDRAQPLNLGTQESFVELGLYEDIIYSHDGRLPLSFRIDWEAPSDLFQGTLLARDISAYLDVTFSYASSSIRVSRMEIGLEEEMDARSEGWTTATLTRTQRGGYGLTVNDKPAAGLGSTRNLTPIKCYGFPPLATQSYPRLNELSLAVEQLARRIYYLGPLRVSPAREYVWAGSAPEGVGRSGETAIQAILANMFERKALKKSERDEVSDLIVETGNWLKRMKLADSFDVKPIGGRQYKVEVNAPGFPISANVADVGVGVSQVLPVIVLSHFVPTGSIIILEQPELHLHPSVQAVLAEFFYEVSIKRNIQFIVETHSEHLLTRLQRRLAERNNWEYTERDVKLYVSQRGESHSEISELQLDASGRILNWPLHFFGDTVSDREAIMKAYLQSKLKKRPEQEDSLIE